MQMQMQMQAHMSWPPAARRTGSTSGGHDQSEHNAAAGRVARAQRGRRARRPAAERADAVRQQHKRLAAAAAAGAASAANSAGGRGDGDAHERASVQLVDGAPRRASRSSARRRAARARRRYPDDAERRAPVVVRQGVPAAAASAAAGDDERHRRRAGREVGALDGGHGAPLERPASRSRALQRLVRVRRLAASRRAAPFGNDSPHRESFTSLHGSQPSRCGCSDSSPRQPGGAAARV